MKSSGLTSPTILKRSRSTFSHTRWGAWWGLGTPADPLGRYRGPHAMRYPFRFVDLRPLTVLACFGGICLTAGGSDRVAEILREKLPRYDPAQHAANAEQAGVSAATERSPILNPDAKPPADAPTRASNLVTDPNVVQLAPFTVRSNRPRSTVKLPRLTVPPSAAEASGSSDPFLSPKERARRLRKKHLNVLTMLLNPGFWGGGIAGESEERTRYAGQLNDVADKIELAAVAGASEQELKQLRELYLKLYLARPK